MLPCLLPCCEPYLELELYGTIACGSATILVKTEWDHWQKNPIRQKFGMDLHCRNAAGILYAPLSFMKLAAFLLDVAANY